jgi:hypothetical protein
MGRACSTNGEQEECIQDTDGKAGGEDQDIGGWIILKCILERYDGVVWTGSNWLRI